MLRRVSGGVHSWEDTKQQFEARRILFKYHSPGSHWLLTDLDESRVQDLRAAGYEVVDASKEDQMRMLGQL